MVKTLTKPSSTVAQENAGFPCATQAASFAVTLRAMPSNVPAEIRLRKLLKLAKRHLALKCIDVAAVPGDGCRTGSISPGECLTGEAGKDVRKC